jgi:low temperature requirement protein LtrA
VDVETKRVSWVELYFDLVFVLAVGQVAHAVAADPTWTGVGIAAGLFGVLWWTWIGFATLYNRLRTEEPVPQRLMIIAATVPCGAAAVAVHGAATGHPVPFAIALAAARVILATAHAAAGWRRAGGQRWLIARGYIFAAVLFGLSTVVPSPWRYLLWFAAVSAESGNLLRVDNQTVRRARKDRDVSALAPADPAEALEPHHFAERFGLFVIILLGELVVSSGQGVLAGHRPGASAWLGLSAGIALAGALWWLYFDSAAEINERMLALSGGSPWIARSIFATGHMPPAFALILVAAGISLLLEGDPPGAAYWMVVSGIAVYLVGTRVIFVASRWSWVTNLALIASTVLLGWLGEALGPTWFLAVAAVWGVGCAALATVRGQRLMLAWRSRGEDRPAEISGKP